MSDKTFLKYTDVKKIDFSIAEESEGYTAEGTLIITLFKGDGFHHSISVKAKDNKLVITEGFGYCPYIPNI
jgi:hypothetical protein